MVAVAARQLHWTDHAVARAAERWPDLPGSVAVARAERLILEAVAEGRRASRLPRSLDPRRPVTRRTRFVWSADGELVGVVKRVKRRGRRGHALLVVTVWRTWQDLLDAVEEPAA